MTAPDEPAVPGGRPPWRTDRGFERVVFFSDAVVAIAMTLLILPMVDTVTTDKAVGVGDLFRDHWGEMFAFALSFVVIAFYWTRHHRLFETIDRYTGTIVWLNMGWLASIVFLPLPTEVLAQASTDDSAAHAFYIGTLVVSSALLNALAFTISSTPEIRNEAPPVHVEATATVLLVVALVISVVVPSVGMWPLMILFLTHPLHLAVDRLRRR